MMDALECEVCLDQFDSSTRKPKLLSCGHTVCLICVVELHRKAAALNDAFLCPKCRRETQSPPNALIDNFYILSLIQDTPKEKPTPTPVRFWCTECSEVADKTCEEKHTICRLQKHRGRVLKDVIDVLERAVSVRRQLADLLRETNQKLDGLLEKQADEIAEQQGNAQASLSLLYDSLELTGPEWERVAATTQQARQSCEDSLPTDEQSLELLRSARRCEVTVHGAEGNTWRADLRVGLGQPEDGGGEAATVVLALLAALQRSRLLSVKTPGPVSDNMDNVSGTSEQTPRSRGNSQLTEGERVPKETSGSPQALGRDTLHLTRLPETVPWTMREPYSHAWTVPIPREGSKATLMTPAASRGTDPQEAQQEIEFWDMLLDGSLQEPKESSSNFEPEEREVLDVSTLSRSAGRRKEKDDLLLNCKSTVKVLRGLHCGVDRAWVCALLATFSRQLESLELHDAAEEHLHAVTAMPRLRKLRLQSNESVVNTLGGCGLPGPGPAQLQYLELDVPLKDVPIIIRMCGGGVPTLRLVLRHYGTDLGQLRSLVAGLREATLQRHVLRQWPEPAGPGPGPRELRRIVLVPGQGQAGHAELRCKMRREVFTSGLPHVQVECSECGAGKNSVEAQAFKMAASAVAKMGSYFVS